MCRLLLILSPSQNLICPNHILINYVEKVDFIFDIFNSINDPQKQMLIFSRSRWSLSSNDNSASVSKNENRYNLKLFERICHQIDTGENSNIHYIHTPAVMKHSYTLQDNWLINWPNTSRHQSLNNFNHQPLYGYNLADLSWLK